MARAFDSHDHEQCVASGIEALETHCAENKLKLTPVRRRVFEILQEQHKAMGAYDILEILSDEGLGKQPPIVYRALDFLVGQRFAHKIEGLNAFIACSHPHKDHDPAFMICRSCDRVEETKAPELEPTRGFAVERTVVQAMGICPDCVEDKE